MTAKAIKRHAKVSGRGKPKLSSSSADEGWNEAAQRRALHAQLAKGMGEFLQSSNVPERGRTAIVAKITHRARQGVARWFKPDTKSGALPDVLSLFLFAQAFQADVNYLLGLSDGIGRSTSPANGASVIGSAPSDGKADALLALAREIAARFPTQDCITMHGDEMEPTIKRGTKVWLDTTCTTIEGNGLYGLELDGRAIVRNVEDRLTEGVRLRCDNPRYGDLVVPSRAELALQGLTVKGKVVGWFQVP